VYSIDNSNIFIVFYIILQGESGLMFLILAAGNLSYIGDFCAN
jgi:hypothetical protein